MPVVHGRLLIGASVLSPHACARYVVKLVLDSRTYTPPVTAPAPANTMLEGLRSRWTTPARSTAARVEMRGAPGGKDQGANSARAAEPIDVSGFTSEEGAFTAAAAYIGRDNESTARFRRPSACPCTSLSRKTTPPLSR